MLSIYITSINNLYKINYIISIWWPCSKIQNHLDYFLSNANVFLRNSKFEWIRFEFKNENKSIFILFEAVQTRWVLVFRWVTEIILKWGKLERAKRNWKIIRNFPIHVGDRCCRQIIFLSLTSLFRHIIALNSQRHQHKITKET